MVVIVTDENDNPPVFDRPTFVTPAKQKLYIGALSMDADPFTRVLILHVSHLQEIFLYYTVQCLVVTAPIE